MPLGEWVLRQACAEAATWPGDLKVAVNLSPVQFKNGNVTQIVFAALASAGLPAARLELEVTESILLEESKINLATLHKLRALGVSISMDDFGTGYSGLSYLRAFPFDKIKIDRSFVSELAENGDCMAIVRAITRLGSSLGIRTTAEGVETEEQRELLRSEGCTEMQGYLLSRPMPASEIAKFLTSYSRDGSPMNLGLRAQADLIRAPCETGWRGEQPNGCGFVSCHWSRFKSAIEQNRGFSIHGKFRHPAHDNDIQTTSRGPQLAGSKAVYGAQRQEIWDDHQVEKGRHRRPWPF